MKRIYFILLSLLFPTISYAASNDVADMAGKITGQMPSLIMAMISITYIGGILAGIKGAIKLKEYNETKGQVKLAIPITYLIMSSFLVSIPSTLDSLAMTLYGEGASFASTFDSWSRGDGEKVVVTMTGGSTGSTDSGSSSSCQDIAGLPVCDGVALDVGDNFDSGTP